MLIDEKLLDIEKASDIRAFVTSYFKKTTADYSAKDIAKRSLTRIGIPPIETMSRESLEKAVLSLFNSEEYKGEVYIRRVQGGNIIYCVNFDTAQKIENHKIITELINKQVKKAVQKGKDSNSSDWKCYERERDFIELREEMERTQQSGETDDKKHIVRIEEMIRETRHITQALFSLFFTDFDFHKLDEDITILNELESSWDFGKEYQELEEVFGTPHFGWKYYKVKDNPILDMLAEKVAAIVLMKLKEEKESS